MEENNANIGDRVSYVHIQVGNVQDENLLAVWRGVLQRGEVEELCDKNNCFAVDKRGCTIMKESITQLLTGVDIKQLLPDQQCAFSIVEHLLNDALTDADTPQYMMLLHEEEGTRKSKVMQTITDVFEQCGVRH